MSISDPNQDDLKVILQKFSKEFKFIENVVSLDNKTHKLGEGGESKAYKLLSFDDKELVIKILKSR